MTMKSKKRPHIVQVTLSDAELAAFQRRADQEGLTKTSFLRQLVIRNCPVVPIEPKSPEAPG